MVAVFANIFFSRLNAPVEERSKFQDGRKSAMKATRISIKWPDGLHMRSAARLVKLARQFHSRILLRVDSQVADARSIMSIMILCVNLSSPLIIEASGDDEHEALQAVAAYFDSGALG